MKEITRRLYTKQAMLGMALLVAGILVVGLFVTGKSRAQGTLVQQGDDKFETTNNGETYHNFSASKIKQDFFGPGSNEYTGVVPLEGVPLAGQGDIDTIIHRNQDVWVPGTTTLKMTALSLKSINPITVTYNNGTPSDQWNVTVSLSTFKDSTGSMTINSGGTMDSSLQVWPRFTFTRVGGGPTLVLDTGDPNGPGLTALADPGVMSGVAIEPQPTATIEPCPVIVNEFDGPVVSGNFSSATASSSCAPVTLTSSGNPWQPCGVNGICFPRPLTEAELLASHNASPPGTKKRILAVKQTVAFGE